MLELGVFWLKRGFCVVLGVFCVVLVRVAGENVCF
jgi:hypothetical protein